MTDIDKLEQLRAAATPGEWREVRGEIWGEELFDQYAVVAPTDDCGCQFERGNAAWLTAIHNAAPELLAELRRLRAIEAAAAKLMSGTAVDAWDWMDRCRELKAALAAKEKP
jgi:hypothetical protein